MRLFTRTHLERAARLAVLNRLTEEDPERAIFEAVASVAEETEEVFTRTQVLEVAVLAAQLAARRMGDSGNVEARRDGEKAVRAVLEEQRSKT